MSDSDARFQVMLNEVHNNVCKLNDALQILNQVWSGRFKTPDGLTEAIKHIGAEKALLERKEAEIIGNMRHLRYTPRYPNTNIEIPDYTFPPLPGHQDQE